MKVTTTWICALLLVVPLAPLVYVADADAQSRNEQRRARLAAQQEEAAATERYPNAARVSPEPETRQRSQTRIRRALDDIDEENYARARSTLQDLEASDRLTDYERAVVYQALAQLAYEESDDANSAIEYWQKAVDLDALPNDTHFLLMYQIAQLHYSEERYDQAIRGLDEWARQTGEDATDTMVLRANALYQLERYPQALQEIDKAIASSSDPADSLFELKMAIHYELDDYEGAARSLEQLVENKPDDIRHKMNLAQMYLELDQTDRALNLLNQARADGLLREAQHWRQLYQLFAYADRHMDAISVINEGLETGGLPADVATLRALGDNYYMAEQLDKAIEALGRAAALSSDGIADQQRGHLLVEADRYPEAKQALQAAFSKGGLNDEGTAWLLLGEAEFETGNRAGAKAAFEKAAGFDSARSNARIWLQNF
ncbi:MAG: tetratricopeptide repeat protein [Xanthomonadales bacterium]|nr:tetratricopeptide repeat protein [Xanthomonadales bacterium]